MDRNHFQRYSDAYSFEYAAAIRRPTALLARSVLYSICAVVICAFIWSFFGKIDETASATSLVIPETEVRAMRSLVTGNITRVLVHAGDVVKKGDPLVEIDPGADAADATRLRESIRLVQNDVERLNAEIQPASPNGMKIDAQMSSLLTARRQHQLTQESVVAAERRAKEARLDEARERLASLRESLISEKRLNAAITQQFESHRRLMDANFLSEKAFFEIEEKKMRSDERLYTLAKDIAAQEKTVLGNREDLEAARGRQGSVHSEHQQSVLTDVKQRREELARLTGELKSAESRTDRHRLTAPYDGYVYNLRATPGPVKEGDELLAVVPHDMPLLVEAKLANKDIGFLHLGIKAKIKIDTFPYQQFGYLEGEVVHIANNAVKEEQLGQIYPVHVRIVKNAIKVGDKTPTIVPGMTAQTDIRLREKRVITFIIEPIARTFTEGLSAR